MILTCIMTPLLVIVIGFAADCGYATYVNQNLARAADSAVTSAISTDAATMVGGYANTAALQNMGNALFAENVKRLSATGATTNINVSSDGNGGYIATATYSYAVPTFFSAVFALKHINVSGTITAAARPSVYVNYYILVDTSQSMGIGATTADMQALYDRTSQYNGRGCVFGCHLTDQYNGDVYANEYLAHSISPKITLRVDAAVTAIQSIITAASQTVGSAGTVKIGLYTLQANPNDGSMFKTITAPTNNFTNLSQLANTIDLGTTTLVHTGDTQVTNELTAFNQVLPSNGSGANSASPKNYVFFITDGVVDTTTGTSDVPGPCFGYYCSSPINPASCQQLQAKATVGVIYTTYLPVYNNNNSASGYQIDYSNRVLPFANNIAPALQGCATSTSFYFEASDGAAIQTALSTLFKNTLPGSDRLTQ